MIRTRRLLLVISTVGILSAWTLGQLPAQKPVPIPPPPGIPVDADPLNEPINTDSMLLPTDREAKGIIVAAKEYITKKDWDVVARSLQYLLEKPEDSFYATVKENSEGKKYTSRVSIRVEANRMIGSLPKEGLEVYQQKFAAKANQMLEEGINKNDPQLLSLVAMRYRHTDAGQKAIAWLADYFLDRGNYQSAVGQFTQLIELLEREKPEVKKELAPKIYFKAALAHQRLGNARDAATAKLLFRQVEESVGEKGLTFGKYVVTLEQLREEFTRNVTQSQRHLAGHAMFRSDPSRTAQGVGGEPFLTGRFQIGTVDPHRSVPEALAERKSSDDAIYKNMADRLHSAVTSMEKTSKGRALLPGAFPIAVQNRVIFRTSIGVFAVWLRDDAASGGKAGGRAWEQLSNCTLFAMSNHQNVGILNSWLTLHQQNPYQYNPGPTTQNNPAPLLFENAQTGSLSSDGQMVYYVDDLAVPPPAFALMNNNFGMPVGIASSPDQAGPAEFIYCNKLSGVGVESGSLVWSIGGRKLGAKPPELFRPNQPVPLRPGQPQPQPPMPPQPPKPFVPPQLPLGNGEPVSSYDELLDTYFLGPPLPLNGLLYVLVESSGEFQLVCLNPARMVRSKIKEHEETPELIWRQPLGTASKKLALDVLRRMQPVHLSYSDGKLVCPTNDGALIAVDLYTRSLSWAYSYRSATPGPGTERLPGQPRIIRGDMMNYQVNFNQERWYPSAPAIVNGRVVFTAHDSDTIQCLNLADGELHWSYKRAPKDLFFAGVFGDKVLVVGKDSVRALDLYEKNKVVWEKKIGLPSGQGVASNGVYYLPLKHGLNPDDPPEVCAINVASGEMHHTRARLKEVPGNLIFHDGDVVSQNLWSLSAYPQLQVKLTEMNRRLEKNPKDPIGLMERGELHLDKGQLFPAVADLRASLESKPPEDLLPKIRTKLYDALTELLQKDFAKAEMHLPVYRDLCVNNLEAEEKQKRHSNYLCIVGKGRENQGRLLEAFEAYMEFGTFNSGRELVPSLEEPGTLAQPVVWARGRIAAMMTKAKSEDLAPLERRLADQWKAIQGGEIEKVRGFVQLFASASEVGRVARLHLAERLMPSENPDEVREAELHLIALSRQTASKVVAAQATADLAQLMIQKKLLDDAVYFYQRLAQEFGTVKLRDGKTGADVYNEIVTQKRFLPYLEPARQGWNKTLQSEAIQGANVGMQAMSCSIVPDGASLPFFRRHGLMLDSNPNTGAGWRLRLVDRIAGAELASMASLGYHPTLVNNPQAMGSLQLAQVQGHIALVTWGNQLLAFDLAEKSERKKLWEFNVLGPTTPAQPNQMGMVVMADGNGMVRRMIGDPQNMFGQLGIFEPSYICVATREGLVALDPLTKNVLWKKELSNAVRLFGDEEYVIIVEANDQGSVSDLKAVRAADGAMVKIPPCRDLLQPSRWLRNVGRNLLVFDDDPKAGKRLRLYDPVTGRDVWSEPFVAAAMPIRSTERVCGALEPNGTLTLFDLDTHKQLIKTRGGPNGEDLIGHMSGVQEVHLLQDHNMFYLVLNKPPTPGVNVYPGVTNGVRTMRIHGHLYAYDRATGEVEWVVANIDNQSLLLEQYQDLPVLICASYKQYFQGANQNQMETKVDAYDKRTGLLICAEKVAPGQFYAMKVDAKEQVIELVRNDVRIRLAPEGHQIGKGQGGGVGQPNAVPVPGVPQAVPLNPGMRIRIMPAQRIQIAPAIPVVPPPIPPPPPPKPGK